MLVFSLLKLGFQLPSDVWSIMNIISVVQYIGMLVIDENLDVIYPKKKKKKSGCASETGIVISQFSSSNWDDLFNFLALCSALLRKILSFFTAILSCGCVCILGRHVMVQIQLVYVM